MKYHTIPRYRLYEADAMGYTSHAKFRDERLIAAGFDMSRPISVEYHEPTNSYVYTQTEE